MVTIILCEYFLANCWFELQICGYIFTALSWAIIKRYCGQLPVDNRIVQANLQKKPKRCWDHHPSSKGNHKKFTVQICKVLVCVKMELPPNSTQKKNPRDMVIGVLIAGETVVIFWRSRATEMSPNICQFMISQSMHDENSLPGWCFKGDLWGCVLTMT